MHTIVIGDKKRLRNPALLGLKALGFEPELASPVYISEETTRAVQSSHLNRVTLGRELMRGEVGCWLAHDNVRRALATSRCHEWHLILEDDATIVGGIDARGIELELEREFGATDKPIVVSLFDSMSLRGLEDLKIVRTPSPPSGTVAYAINQAYCQAVNHFGIAMTADWPLFAQAFDFFRFSPAIAREIEGVSGISAGSRSISSSKFYLSLLQRLVEAFRLGLPPSLALRAILINPVRRDLFYRLRCQDDDC